MKVWLPCARSNLGVWIDGDELCSGVTDERYWLVYRGIHGLLEKGRCCGWVLEILLGHMTFAALSSRAFLTCLHGCYAFCRRYYSHVGVLWPTAVEELKGFAGLMVSCRPIGGCNGALAFCRATVLNKVGGSWLESGRVTWWRVVGA